MTYAPVDHPGTPVPSELRDWGTPWPDYTPVDITPEKLRPAALASPDGWVVDHHTDPAQVSDWPERLARAVVPYRLDAQGRPLNPTGRTGRTGRNLKSWGENQAADPVVVAGTGVEQHILLIRRGDNQRWAISGGMVDPGEQVTTTLARELHEEASIDLTGMDPQILFSGYVDDWRNSDQAWVSTTVGLYRLETMVTATAGDDAAEAAWWPWTGDIDALAAHLEPHGGLYDAHRPLLNAAANA